MQDSIFTKIINGEIPCHKIYEDAQTFVFLDVYPIQPGQVLVVPKRQVEFAWDLPTNEYTALMATVQKIAQRLKVVFTEVSHVGMQVEGLDVAHAHVKLFPFNTDEEFHNHPNRSVDPDHAALAAVASKLKLNDEL